MHQGDGSFFICHWIESVVSGQWIEPGRMTISLFILWSYNRLYSLLGSSYEFDMACVLSVRGKRELLGCNEL